MRSAPARGGARRPEKRVTVKSKLPQKKWTGLHFPKDKWDEIMAFDRAAWRSEVMGHEELFLDLHDRLPKEMIFERELLICRM